MDPTLSTNVPVPTVGRIVNYVTRDGKIRPAIIVHIFPSVPISTSMTVQLQQFTDLTNDGEAQNVVWRTSVPYSADPKPETWHWPKRY